MDYKFDFDLDLVGAQYDFQYWWARWSWSDQTSTYTGTWDFNNTTYTPDNINSPDRWKNGTWNTNPKGTYTVTDGTNTYTVTFTLNNLHTSSNCPSSFDGGSFTISGNCDPSGIFQVTVKYTSCGQGSESWLACDGSTGSWNF
ncbi:MAG: hypothetical protein D6778_06610 [Nitrospirae bacterium]|nr:MAG: hypothetical protein D6778_06610 [Nitrospirota bacterium]